MVGVGAVGRDDRSVSSLNVKLGGKISINLPVIGRDALAEAKGAGN